MRRRVFAFVVSSGILIGAILINAAQPNRNPAANFMIKGAVVTMLIPSNLFDNDGALMSGAPIYATLISTVNGATAVKGRTDWKTAGFPVMLSMKTEKVNRKKEYTEVEFRAAEGVGAAVKLRFLPDVSDIPAALAELVAPGPMSGSEAQSRKDQAYAALADKFFTGPLSSLSTPQRLLLVTFAHITASGTTISSEEYRGNLYLVVDLGRDTSVYNDLQLNQSARVARVTSDKLLTILKAFAKPVEGVSAIHGLKLKFDIPHKSFLDKTAASETDVLQLYAPAELIKKFADADITNQQFIDGCIVIVNDNRIQVPLSSS
jgi:hypothetical protein